MTAVKEAIGVEGLQPQVKQASPNPATRLRRVGGLGSFCLEQSEPPESFDELL